MYITKVSTDQYQYLGNCPPTPPLTQQQSIDNKSGLMFGWGRGRWAVTQILILIHFYSPIFTLPFSGPSPITRILAGF